MDATMPCPLAGLYIFAYCVWVVCVSLRSQYVEAAVGLVSMSKLDLCNYVEAGGSLNMVLS